MNAGLCSLSLSLSGLEEHPTLSPATGGACISATEGETTRDLRHGAVCPCFSANSRGPGTPSLSSPYRSRGQGGAEGSKG